MSTYSQTILGTPGLIAYFRLNEPTSSFTAEELLSGGSGNYLPFNAPNGGPRTQVNGATCDGDKASYFPPLTDRSFFNNAWCAIGPYALGTEHTIEAWYYPGEGGSAGQGGAFTCPEDQSSSQQGLSGTQPPNTNLGGCGAGPIIGGYEPNYGLACQSDATTDALLYSLNNFTVSVSETNVAIDSWKHAIVTRSGAEVKFYLNGVQVGETQVLPNANDTLEVGAISAFIFGTHGFWGSIDEVSLYDRALSDNEVLSHFAAGSCTQYPTTGAPSNLSIGALASNPSVIVTSVIDDYQILVVSKAQIGNQVFSPSVSINGDASAFAGAALIGVSFPAIDEVPNPSAGFFNFHAETPIITTSTATLSRTIFVSPAILNFSSSHQSASAITNISVSGATLGTLTSPSSAGFVPAPVPASSALTGISVYDPLVSAGVSLTPSIASALAGFNQAQAGISTTVVLSDSATIGNTVYAPFAVSGHALVTPLVARIGTRVPETGLAALSVPTTAFDFKAVIYNALSTLRPPLPRWMLLFKDPEAIMNKLLGSWWWGSVLPGKDVLSRLPGPYLGIGQLRRMWAVNLNNARYASDDAVPFIDIEGSFYKDGRYRATRAKNLRACLNNLDTPCLWYYDSQSGFLFINNIALIQVVVSNLGGSSFDMSAQFNVFPPETDAPLYLQSRSRRWKASPDTFEYQYPFVYLPEVGNYLMTYPCSSIAVSAAQGITVWIDGSPYPIQEMPIRNDIDEWGTLLSRRRRAQETNRNFVQRLSRAAMMSTQTDPSYQFLRTGNEIGLTDIYSWESVADLTLPASSLYTHLRILGMGQWEQEVYLNLIPDTSGKVLLFSSPLAPLPLEVVQGNKVLEESSHYTWNASALQLLDTRPFTAINLRYWVKRYELSINASGYITGVLKLDTTPEGRYFVIATRGIRFSTPSTYKIPHRRWDHQLSVAKGKARFD